LKEHLLHDFVAEQLRLSRDVDLPMLKFFSHLSDEELLELSVNSITEFLNFLSKNEAEQHVKVSIDRWKAINYRRLKKPANC
jgi:hypothetical protein